MQHHAHTRNEEILHKRGYRLTPQRYLILHVIQEANGHLSIEQLTERVQKLNPRVSLSTIYRTLELLQELGLVREHRLPGEPAHYEIPQGKTHHHLVCRACRTLVHLDSELLGNLHERLQEQHHFHGLTLNLLAEGYCNHCWQKLQRE